jgi:hypothetical protein
LCSFVPAPPLLSLPFSSRNRHRAHYHDHFTPVLLPPAVPTLSNLIFFLLTPSTSSPWFSRFYIFNIGWRVHSGYERRPSTLVVPPPPFPLGSMLSRCVVYCLIFTTQQIVFTRTAVGVSASVTLGRRFFDDRYTRSISRDR